MSVEVTHVLKAYIIQAGYPVSGGFTIPLPTTPKEVEPFLKGFGITDTNDVNIARVHAADGLNAQSRSVLDETMSSLQDVCSLDELNYLATLIQDMDEERLEMFGAILQSPWCADTLSGMIDLAQNLQRFDLIGGVLDAKAFGEMTLDEARGDGAQVLVSLQNSSASTAQRFAKHIKHLEQSVNVEAYGRMAAKDDGGVFTDFGYLAQWRDTPATYRGIQDIPKEYRLSEEEKVPLKVKVTLIDQLKALKQKSREQRTQAPPAPKREESR